MQPALVYHISLRHPPKCFAFSSLNTTSTLRTDLISNFDVQPADTKHHRGLDVLHAHFMLSAAGAGAGTGASAGAPAKAKAEKADDETSDETADDETAAADGFDQTSSVGGLDQTKFEAFPQPNDQKDTFWDSITPEQLVWYQDYPAIVVPERLHFIAPCSKPQDGVMAYGPSAKNVQPARKREDTLRYRQQAPAKEPSIYCR